MLAQSFMNGPVNEQTLRKSHDPKAGQGQDDSIPNIPSMSIDVAELEKQRLLGHGYNETLFVSKDHNVQADMYMESDAEEIYMPDGAGRGRGFGRNKRVSTTTEDDSGIVGY